MEVVKMFTFFHIIIKTFLTRFKILDHNPNLLLFITLLITVITLPVGVIVNVVFLTYQYLVVTYLKNMNPHFVRVTDGIETVTAVSNNCIVSVILQLDFNGDVNELYESTIKKIEEIKKTKHEKLFYLIDNLMGYFYFYRQSNVNPSDYVRVMSNISKDTLEIKDFSEEYMRYGNSCMPLNNTGLCEFIICPKKMLHKSSQKFVYPLVIRLHHLIGDGQSINFIVGKLIGDSTETTVQQPTKRLVTKLSDKVNVKNVVSKMKLKNIPLTIKDDNILRGYNLEENKHVYYFNHSTKNYMNIIKKIRNKFKETTHLDIINTAFASGMHDYFKKYSPRKIPESVIGGIAVALSNVQTNTDFELTNHFSCGFIKLPINEATGLTDKLKFVQKEYDTLMKSFDAQLNYGLCELFIKITPSKILRGLVKYVAVTVGISSLAGIQEFTIFKGIKVMDVFVVSPNSPGTGIHIYVTTYGSRFLFNMTIDKSVISEYEKGQELLDNVIKAIDELSNICDNLN